MWGLFKVCSKSQICDYRPCYIIHLRTIGIAPLNNICSLLEDLPTSFSQQTYFFESSNKVSQKKYFLILAKVNVIVFHEGLIFF